jgi:hypothetical protein
MQVAFALFADAANLSQEGKLNILGVFDAVQVGALPTVHRRASLVVHLKGDEMDAGVHTLTLRWLSPSGEELWNTQGQVEVQTAPPPGSAMDLPLIAAVDLPLDQPGSYAMQIAVDDRPSASVALHVRSAAPPPFAPLGFTSPAGGLVS